MLWYWRARMYRPNGDYYTCQIPTAQNLNDIKIIQAFYTSTTGCQLLLEGMTSEPTHNIANPLEAFTNLWKGRIDV